MLVHNFIFHYVDKTGESASGQLFLRDSVLPESALISQLIEQLHDRFDDATAPARGFFNSDEDTYPLSRWLQEYVDGDVDFAGFSQASTLHLGTLIPKSDAYSGGHVLFAHCSQGVTDYLYIAVLQLHSGFAVTQELKVVPSLQLDLNRLRMTARINLSLWGTDGESAPYISFIDGQSQVPFAEFIGCNEAPCPSTRCGQSLPTHPGDQNE
ncbi:nucleoid-associated protein [Pseudomonas graminis]|uniref:nucleoid-associated protein n=1 Tax=Pseudomonas graminis TaxID=158627 RepID=UPI003C25B246